jgi:hypothetical protein
VAVIPSGQVGSIGVFSMHVDTTAAEEAEGVKVTIVKAGKYKAENMEPLTDAAREAMQQQVDTYYDTFVADVAKGRGVAPKVVRETYGEGRVVLAKDALAAGMVDRIATLEEVLRGMQASGRSNGRGTAVRTMAITPELCARLGGGIQAVVSEELPQDIRVVGARCLDPGADANVEGERVIEIDLESGEFSADISNPLPAPMIRRYFPSVAHSETSLLAVNLLEALSEYGDIHAAFDQPKLLGALQAALMDCRLPKETPKRDAATQGIRLMDMEAGEGNGEEVTG